MTRALALLAAAALALMSLGALAAAPASAQGGGGNAITVIALDSGAEFWFEIEGEGGRNPPLTLQPGQQYTITLRNEGEQVHNLHIGGPVDQATDIIGPRETATLQFTVPPDAVGEDQYWCDPHLALGMAGPLAFSASGADGNGTAPDVDGDNTGGNATDGNATDGNATDGNATDGGTGGNGAAGDGDDGVDADPGNPAPSEGLEDDGGVQEAQGVSWTGVGFVGITIVLSLIVGTVAARSGRR